MKTKLIIAAAGMAMLLAFTSPAFAANYIFQPTPADLNDLNHHYYYVWGVDWVPQPDEVLVDATLSISNVNNWVREDNILYIHLIDEAPSTVVTEYDGISNVDDLVNWTQGTIAGPNILLDTYSDVDGTYGESNPGTDYSYSFASNGTLDDLLLFSSNNGDFSIGFDPDCHYYNNGITLELITRNNVIPEPATILLMTSGLIGMAFRRKFA